ncbi:MAG: tRNA 4-thiouridine(8) synthase ThiI [Actinomycetota bacterium]|nr:tRNA 4-thiouridine(8) synthase ThiI [Actinomycetota bacterium]
MKSDRLRAIALFSGGLDSILAVKLIEDQGIEVIGVTFVTPFFSAKAAEKSAKEIGIPLIIKDITEEHFEVVKSPKRGRGKNMNPCIDCHSLMVKVAGELMEETGASFIISGEVLGERPMSQRRDALKLVEKDSGFEGYLLRPLSAKLLDETIPEREGLVDRERLLGISGRSRRVQLELAEKYGLKEFPAPAGGCLLTDIGFSNKLKELLKRNENPSRKSLEVLRFGRHFWLDGALVIVGRDQNENDNLLKLAEEGDTILFAKDFPGPLTLIKGEVGDDILKKAAELTTRYGKAKELGEVEMVYRKPWQEPKTFTFRKPKG